MTITILISITAEMVISGVYSCLPPLPILYSLCLQQAPLPGVLLYLAEWLNLYS